eukprot:TRINITY_DN29697_c0_g1_i1.p1 TRINITY_DN29697_c0_g1~~TRINITY_DN29697_c0_g1_i1.p1  ORF type:complete len:560 (-),score=51.56 TRINITY_DN29697_c0_g1_i1:40-1539(-)
MNVQDTKHWYRKTELGEWTGAVISVLGKLSAEMGFELKILEKSDCDPHVQWNSFDCRLKATGQVVPMVRPTNYHYDLDIKERETNVFVSLPVAVHTEAGLLHRVHSPVDMFQVFTPFTGRLWLAILLATVVVAFSVPFINAFGTPEDSQNQVHLKSPLTYVRMFLLVFGELLAVGDLDWGSGLAARVLKLGWLFVILITSATYTANLAAILLRPSWVVRGPTSMAELSKARVCLPYFEPNPSNPYWETRYGVGQIVGSVTYAVDNEDVLRELGKAYENLTTQERTATSAFYAGQDAVSRCAEKVANGKADVVIQNRPTLQRWLLTGNSTRCREWLFAPDISFHHTMEHLTFNRSYGYEFFTHFQQGLIWMQHHGSMTTMYDILHKHYLQGEVCPKAELGENSQQIDFFAQAGVFLIFGILCGLSWFIFLAEKYLKPRCPETAQRKNWSVSLNDLSSATDGDMLRFLVKQALVTEDALKELRSSSQDRPSTLALEHPYAI